MSDFEWQKVPAKPCYCVGPQGKNICCPCELERQSYKKQCNIDDFLSRALRDSATKISKGRRKGDL